MFSDYVLNDYLRLGDIGVLTSELRKKYRLHKSLNIMIISHFSDVINADPKTKSNRTEVILI